MLTKSPEASEAKIWKMGLVRLCRYSQETKEWRAKKALCKRCRYCGSSFSGP